MVGGAQISVDTGLWKGATYNFSFKIPPVRVVTVASASKRRAADVACCCSMWYEQMYPHEPPKVRCLTKVHVRIPQLPMTHIQSARLWLTTHVCIIADLPPEHRPRRQRLPQHLARRLEARAGHQLCHLRPHLPLLRAEPRRPAEQRSVPTNRYEFTTPFYWLPSPLTLAVWFLRVSRSGRALPQRPSAVREPGQALAPRLHSAGHRVRGARLLDRPIVSCSRHDSSSARATFLMECNEYASIHPPRAVCRACCSLLMRPTCIQA